MLRWVYPAGVYAANAMSTFIYQNGILYADTRKIVNFPKRQMMLATNESKVKSNSWSHVAIGGFEKDNDWWDIFYRSLTVMESFYALISVLDIMSEQDKNRRNQYRQMLKDVKALQTRFGKKMATYYDDSFLVVTKRRVYGFDGDLATCGDTPQLLVHALDSIESVGSSAPAARILLINGVPPAEIYKLLREGYSPTGETCEEFRVADLSNAIAPWSHESTWISCIKFLSASTGDKDNLSDREKQHLTAMASMVPSMATISNNTIRASTKRIGKIAELWCNENYLKFSSYKENYGVFFK